MGETYVALPEGDEASGREHSWSRLVGVESRRCEKAPLSLMYSALSLLGDASVGVNAMSSRVVMRVLLEHKWFPGAQGPAAPSDSSLVGSQLKHPKQQLYAPGRFSHSVMESDCVALGGVVPADSALSPSCPQRLPDASKTASIEEQAKQTSGRSSEHKRPSSAKASTRGTSLQTSGDSDGVHLSREVDLQLAHYMHSVLNDSGLADWAQSVISQSTPLDVNSGFMALLNFLVDVACVCVSAAALAFLAGANGSTESAIFQAAKLVSNADIPVDSTTMSSVSMSVQSWMAPQALMTSVIALSVCIFSSLMSLVFGSLSLWSMSILLPV